jgi:hypothetical protein
MLSSIRTAATITARADNIPDPPIGAAGIVVEPTDDLLRLQQKIIDALAPFAVKTGTAAAFVTTEDGRDIQKALIDYVTSFVAIGSGRKFNPHVTIGVATEAYLKEMLAEPFEAFTFSPVSASVYQLGTFLVRPARNSRLWC